ncbi:MAG: hypothetical protein N2115_04375 [bacterium]|nr:hypothetical protein [bacterium]
MKKNIWIFHIENFPGAINKFPCRISIPAVKDIKSFEFSVERPDGSIVMGQPRTIVRQADGKPRWIQVDFEGNGNGKYTIRNMPVREKAGCFLQTRKFPEKYSVQTGRLRVEILKRERFPVGSIFFNQKQVISENSQWQLVAIAGGKFFQFKTDIDSFNIESDGLHRFQLSWKGVLVNPETGEKLLDVKCRMEFLSGIEGFSLSIHVFHCLAGKPFLEIDYLGFQCSIPHLERVLVCQKMQSNLAQKKIVETQKDIEIFLDKTRFHPYVKDASLLDDEFDYPVFLRGFNNIVGSAVCLKNNEVSVCTVMRDFIHQRPKKIELSKGTINYHLWPEFAGTLNIQQGSSYRAIFDFCLSDDDEYIRRVLEKPELLYVEPVYGWLEQSSFLCAGDTFHHGIFSEKDAGLFSWLLYSATSRFHTVSAMFHYGDTVDEGYTQYYFSQARYPRELQPTGILFNTHGGVYHIASGFEPVWANNEYDAIYCLALEAIRTRNATVLKRLIAAARHQIETDFVYHSDHWQQNRSTPQHSYGHIRMMSSLPSHQWTQGLYHYYVLTGDDDAIDVIRGICDYNMSYFDKIPVEFNNFFNREYGWAILALVYGFEATGYTPYIEKAERMIRELEKNTSTEDAKKSFGMGFASNTVLLGLMAFHQATKKQWAKNLFLKWVNCGLPNFNDKKHGPKITELFIEPLTYAYHLTKDKKYLHCCFWHFELFFKGWQDLGWFSGKDVLSTKKYARVYRALIHFISACKKAKILSKLEKIATRF